MNFLGCSKNKKLMNISKYCNEFQALSSVHIAYVELGLLLCRKMLHIEYRVSGEMNCYTQLGALKMPGCREGIWELCTAVQMAAALALHSLMLCDSRMACVKQLQCHCRLHPSGMFDRLPSNTRQQLGRAKTLMLWLF
jgi:hypothetical protein